MMRDQSHNRFLVQDVTGQDSKDIRCLEIFFLEIMDNYI